MPLYFQLQAHLKGLDPSKTGQIGLIIGVFQLIMLITAPIIGRYVSSILLQFVNVNKN